MPSNAQSPAALGATVAAGAAAGGIFGAAAALAGSFLRAAAQTLRLNPKAPLRCVFPVPATCLTPIEGGVLLAPVPFYNPSWPQQTVRLWTPTETAPYGAPLGTFTLWIPKLRSYRPTPLVLVPFIEATRPQVAAMQRLTDLSLRNIAEKGWEFTREERATLTSVTKGLHDAIQYVAGYSPRSVAEWAR